MDADKILDFAMRLLGMAFDLAPALKKSLAIVNGSEHAPRLAEIMKDGNTARKALEE